jgi:iron complex outermembrane receptor protein
MVLSVAWAMAQTRQVSGRVTEADGTAIPGANVAVKGTTTGTSTDGDGRFSLNVPQDAATLVISAIGFATREVSITGQSEVSVTLETAALELGEVVISTGARSNQRTLTDTPLPIDILSSNDLRTTGQVTFDKALQYRVPSFNTVMTPVNDATSLLDPYEIRNMGPSRTLILINGKRKNSSALVYTQTSPGRGESGADISAIPADAIERVEILRDGASAQYGSDAIAGVMNIILKSDASTGNVTVRTGVTSEGDGGMFGVSLNNGTTLFGKGFLNYTIDMSKVGQANRPGTVDAQGESGDFGAPLADVQAFLANHPDAGNINGSPETTASKFLVNGGSAVSENTSMYFNAAYVYKKVNSFANYRTPYWRTLADYPYLQDFFPGPNGGPYEGYVPTFDGDLNDYNATLGFKSTKNNWITDVSFTVGGNKQMWTVRNSHNRNTVGVRDSLGNLKYRENSPINFDAGGVAFNHMVGNLDVSRVLSDKVTFAFGTEFRSENFEVIEGDLASYEGGGADSYAGNTEANSFKSNRYNYGGYVDFGFDFTENFMLNATGRFENYSDFGNAFVYKLSTRYKLAGEKATLRASYSTGFRAPSLHQIYTQKDQYSFVPGSGIQVQGLVNNVSPQANLIGVPKLDAEQSTNFTIGAGIRPTENLSFTIDYYDIRVEDRIILGNDIVPTGDPLNPLDQILTQNSIVSMSFFVNGLDTKTSGIDLVASYKNLNMGNGKLGFNLAGNYTLTNEREGDIKNPPIIAAAGQDVVNFTQEALMFTSRPQYKAILGADYTTGKWNFNLNGTLFGPTKFRNAGMDSNLQVEFSTNVVVDLGINYRMTNRTMIALNINNVFNALPQWSFKALTPAGETILADPAQVKTQSNLITFNQRYSMVTYDGSQFSQLGTIFNAALSFRL